jgi:UDPglucose 6-dehydrogenase
MGKNFKKICIIGSGYVGLVTGACLAEAGHTVVCVDKDQARIKKLRKGIVPIYEPGLKKIISRNFKEGRLSFSGILGKAVKKSEAVFIAVGTPSSRRGDGYADLNYVYQATETLAPYIKKYKVVVNKSTVPAGTAKQVARIIKKNNPQAKFDVVSNPEFLREGVAVTDFMNPDRVVIGADSQKAQRVMKEIYSFIEEDKLFFVKNAQTAELIKYASNAFLATKISFINEMANLCENLGADVIDLAKGMGMDKRIGSLFLEAGAGYGGSCFPKDVKALLRIAQENEASLRVVEAVAEANNAQKARMVKKIRQVLGEDEVNKKVLFLGLTFKPDTDDLRESPALTIIPALAEKGIEIVAHDPQGMKEAKKELPQSVNYTDNIYRGAKGASAIVLMTDWEAYHNLNFEKLKKEMKEPVFIDLRNAFQPKEMRKMGFVYTGVGR